MDYDTATNPQTGARVISIGGQWKALDASATNPQTGARAFKVDGQWMTAPKSENYSQRLARTGAALDKAGADGRWIPGAVEDAAAIGSGIAGDIAGAATSIATQNPKRGEALKQAITYEPRTEAGKAGLEYAGALTKPIGDVFAAPVRSLQRHGHPIAAQAVQAAEDVLGAKAGGEVEGGAQAAVRGARALPGIPRRIAEAGEERAAVRAAEEAPKQAKIAQARSIGLKLAPSEAGGAVGKTLEGAGGKIQTEMSLSRANAKVINRTAAKEIGLTEKQPLTEANIDRLKKGAFEAYDRVKKAGRIEADDAFRKELDGVKERTAQAQQDYPEDTNELIDKEIEKFNRPSADASSMVEKIKSLRNRATRNMQSPDAEKFELGIAQKKIASSMENLIERQVGARDPGLIKDFRAARTQLAKIYNVEDALGPNGNLSAAVLARQLKRGVPLSGGLKTIAETYQEFPRVMRYVDSLGGHAPFSALDYLVGGVEAVAHPAGAARVVGALAARPLARGIIRSEAYQRAGIRPREVRPSIASRAARKMVGGHTLEKNEEAPRRLTLKDEGQ